MSAPKPIRIEYQSKGYATGLTDVKAQVYVNGVAKAIGAQALLLTELDATNMPGNYELVLSSAQLTTWGIVAGGENTISGYINSVSKPGYAPFRQQISFYNADDLQALIGTPTGASVSADLAALSAKVGTPAGASVSVDIANVKSDTAAIKADLETGSASLATILTNIQALQNASIGNGVGFVLPTMLIPANGTNTYQIPITIQNDVGALVDPTSNTITVGVKNAAGADRGSYLSGSSGSPATVSATRTGVGQYVATVILPTSAIEEELIFSFAYQIGSNPMVRFGVSQVIVDGGAAGYALQSTLVATQTTVNAINSAVSNATYGLSALQALLANGTYGLSAIQSLLANSTYGLSALQAILGNGTYGLQALGNLLTNATYGLSALQVQGAATQGTGFTPGQDDLHSISQFLRTYGLPGGRAV